MLERDITALRVPVHVLRTIAVFEGDEVSFAAVSEYVKTFKFEIERLPRYSGGIL